VSVVAEFPVLQRPWRGYDSPGLPAGMWIAQGTALGDASGGTQSVGFVFKDEAVPLGGRFYNLEQLSVHATFGTITDMALVLLNFDIVGSTGLVNREHHLTLSTDGVTTASLVDMDGPRLPLFLGRPSLVGLNTVLRIRTSNLNNETVFFTCQGYIWEPRSLLEDGGLRRPLDSLYG